MERDVSQVAAADAAEITALLARYAHVIDNRAWDEADSVFADDARLGQPPAPRAGIDRLRAMVGDAPATHGHNTTDVVLDQHADGTVRAWCKFFIVRGDGTVGSGDYQDTLVRTADGWRILTRDVSRGNRLDSDPTGGPSRAYLHLRQLAATGLTRRSGQIRSAGGGTGWRGTAVGLMSWSASRSCTARTTMSWSPARICCSMLVSSHPLAPSRRTAPSTVVRQSSPVNRSLPRVASWRPACS